MDHGENQGSPMYGIRYPFLHPNSWGTFAAPQGHQTRALGSDASVLRYMWMGFFSAPNSTSTCV